MDDIELRSTLERLREQLQQFWRAWAEERGRPEAADGTTMCRFTSEFLVQVLGDQWMVEGGESHVEGFAGGFFDGSTWHGHYWVTDGERIVDLTANQFGAAPIIITSTEDPRYASNYSPCELEYALENVRDRASSWVAACGLYEPA